MQICIASRVQVDRGFDCTSNRHSNAADGFPLELFLHALRFGKHHHIIYLNIWYSTFYISYFSPSSELQELPPGSIKEEIRDDYIKLGKMEQK
jgi:hypothetical protein